jgi:hypothetical protein
MRIASLAQDDDLPARVDAFVARLGRLQDTFGDKLLPALQRAREENPDTMVENLDPAGKPGLIESADTWIAMRRLRHRMIHESVKQASDFADALMAAHELILALLARTPSGRSLPNNA